MCVPITVYIAVCSDNIQHWSVLKIFPLIIQTVITAQIRSLGRGYTRTVTTSHSYSYNSCIYTGRLRSTLTDITTRARCSAVCEMPSMPSYVPPPKNSTDQTSEQQTKDWTRAADVLDQPDHRSHAACQTQQPPQPAATGRCLHASTANMKKSPSITAS